MTLYGRVHGDGRPIVVLPWLGVDHAVMVSACEPVLAKVEGWSRLYLDLPGNGQSPPVAPNSDAVLDAVHAELERRLQGEPFLLIGCSYGGYLAAGLARRLPSRVGGLLLVCSGPKIRLQDRDLGGLSRSVPEPGWLDDVPAGLHEHFRQAVGHQSAGTGSRMARAFALGRPSDESYLSQLRGRYQLHDEGARATYDGPVTLIAGRKDRIAGYRDQFAALGHYPRGTYVLHADAGHYLPFEQPTFFGLVLRAWLGECESRLAHTA